MLQVRSGNDHFRKAIPKIKEFVFLPKTYLPEIRPGTQRQAGERVGNPMQSGLKLEVVNGSAPNEFTVGAEQGDSMMAAMKHIIEPKIEMNGSFSKRIKMVSVSRFIQLGQLPLQKSSFRPGRSFPRSLAS